MPPIVRLALWYRLLGSWWRCPECRVQLIGGFGGQHIVRMHPWSTRAKHSWIHWFDDCVASMWA